MTRQRVNLRCIPEKKLLDKGLINKVELPEGLADMRQGGDALSSIDNSEGIKINDDIWAEEFIAVGMYLCRMQDDPDLYDLFMWIREELHGGQPFGPSMVARVDAEIEKELGPWT